MRTPLNGILAYSEILSTDAATLQPAELAEIGHVIYGSGRRLMRLVENFLIYAQLELLRVDPARAATLRKMRTPFPARLIEAKAREQAQAARRSADLRLEVRDVAPPLAEDYLVRIMEELVQNAFKFSKPGTPVQVALAALSGEATLTVADRGRGLSPDQIAQVGAYMQFDRKMQEQQGLGLGLTICRRLAELHGGTLALQSQVGEGTTATLKFPSAAD